MSDHKIVITEINIKPKPKKTVPRKVYTKYFFKKPILMESANTLIKRIMFLPIIQKQIAFKNVGENLKKYYRTLLQLLFQQKCLHQDGMYLGSLEKLKH